MKKFIYSGDVDCCWRDCIANMIGKMPKQVPDFVGKSKNHWLKNTFKYLDKLGYTLIIYKLDMVSRFLAPIGYHIRAGQSVGGYRHACIYFRNIMMFDPGKGGGLQEGTVEDYYFITKKKDKYCQLPE